jgi:hypothetical protein
VIRLDAQSSVLSRFARELDAQAPMSLAGLTPDLGAHSREDVEAARVAWASRIVDEYRSVVVFGELLVLLARIEAPYPALCAVQRLIGDELRHTHLCADVADLLRGRDDLAIDLRELGLPETDDPPAGRALEIIVRELVVAETESVYALRAYRDATTDPACRAALSILLRDEARHAATGRCLARTLLDGFRPAALGDVPGRLATTAAEDIAFIRGQHRRGARDGPGRALGACVLPHELPE